MFLYGIVNLVIMFLNLISVDSNSFVGLYLPKIMRLQWHRLMPQLSCYGNDTQLSETEKAVD